MEPPENRDELRKRLREKLRGKRDTRNRVGGPSDSMSVQKVEEIMLNAFGNDPETLRTITEVMKQPKKALKELSSAPPTIPTIQEEFSEDEEAPPE